MSAPSLRSSPLIISRCTFDSGQRMSVSSLGGSECSTSVLILRRMKGRIM